MKLATHAVPGQVRRDGEWRARMKVMVTVIVAPRRVAIVGLI